jgi:hypothetical protein
LASATFFAACGGGMNGTSTSSAPLRATIGPAGGQLVGQKGSAFEGVQVTIRAGALDKDTEIEVKAAADDRPLPSTATRCGPEFDILPDGLQLAMPASVTLPFDEGVVQTNFRFDDEVKVWAVQSDKWGQVKQTDSTEGSVTIDLGTLTRVAAGVNPPQQKDIVKFDLHVNPKSLACLAEYPNDPSRAPAASVTIVRGDLNDALFLNGRYIKPELAFDVFTVEHSNLQADGTVDPNFKNFGLAWYQSDLQANDEGRARTVVRTILLDQIFGFDPAATLPPTQTFELGFWFNNPQDAVACGFNAAAPTPFNGEHQAGPLAMISVPDASTGLGPLCTKPDTSTTPAHCSP